MPKSISNLVSTWMTVHGLKNEDLQEFLESHLETSFQHWCGDEPYDLDQELSDGVDFYVRQQERINEFLAKKGGAQ